MEKFLVSFTTFTPPIAFQMNAQVTHVGVIAYWYFRRRNQALVYDKLPISKAKYAPMRDKLPYFSRHRRKIDLTVWKENWTLTVSSVC